MGHRPPVRLGPVRCRPFAFALLLAAWSPAATAQAPPRGATAAATIHPHLRERLAAVGGDTRVSVYFVLADRLDLDALYGRVLPLPLPARRATAIAALRAHAATAQAPLLELLATAAADGAAGPAQANWLGNFVGVAATRAAIERAAALPGVEAVCCDAAVEPAATQDGAADDPAGADAARTGATGRAPATVVPGDGPLWTAAAAAWFYGVRGQGVVIANVDGGLTAHGDLDGRRWSNAGEVAGNGRDDDGNGFVDDVHGFAFDTGTAGFDDQGGHGTMTAGLLVGDGSCTGIAHGQAPAAQLMTCRVLSETSHWNAVQYALAMGADVQTSSFSYKAHFVPPPNYRMHRDVATASLVAGLIRVNSAGNDGLLATTSGHPARVPCNIAAPACVPSPYPAPEDAAGGRSGVLGIGAFDFAQQVLDPLSPRGPFAWSLADLRVNLPNYPAAAWDSVHHDDYPWQAGARPGLIKPDLLGPARATTTTAGPCGTIVFGGTSSAAPCVAGTIALWKSANPSLTPEDAAMIAHQTAQSRSANGGKADDVGAGTVDAERGLYRALCVLRLDHRSAWQVEHALGTAVDLAIDGAPSSPCAVLVGYQRANVPVGPLLLGIGQPNAVLFVGVTDAHGDRAWSVDVASNTAGQQFVAQAVLLDTAVTQRLLDSNIVGITFTP